MSESEGSNFSGIVAYFYELLRRNVAGEVVFLVSGAHRNDHKANDSVCGHVSCLLMHD
jgi:hypothetical protein